MLGRWDAKNNPRDYGIEEPYWGQGDPYSTGAFCVQAQSNDFSIELTKTSKILVT